MDKVTAVCVIVGLGICGLVWLYSISPWLILAVVVGILAIIVGVARECRRSEQRYAEAAEWCREQGRKAAIEKQRTSPAWPTRAAERLARERPPGWEFYLAEELLTSQLRPLREGFAQFPTGGGFAAGKLLSESELLGLLKRHTDKLKSCYVQLGDTFNKDLMEAWGPPGVAGDPAMIAVAVNRIVVACRGLLDWEREIRAIVPPAEYVGVVRAMDGWGRHAFRAVEEVTERLTNLLAGPNLTGHHVIAFTMTAPPGTQRMEKEMQQIVNRRQAQLRAQNDLVTTSLLMGLLGVWVGWHLFHPKPSKTCVGDSGLLL